MFSAGSAGPTDPQMRFFFTQSRFLSSLGIFLAANAFLYPVASLAQRTSTELAASPAIVPEEAPTLEEVVVTGQSAVEGAVYAAQESRIATKTRTLLLETTQAVSVVTRKLIEDEGVQDLEGALRNVAGVSVGGYYNEWDYERIRGFDASYADTYLDGLLADGAPFEELWAFERIEVIKGPRFNSLWAGTTRRIRQSGEQTAPAGFFWRSSVYRRLIQFLPRGLGR